LLGTPCEIEGMGGMGDHVELVERHLGIGERPGHPLDEGRRQVDREGLDGLGIPAVGRDLGGQPLAARKDIPRQKARINASNRKVKPASFPAKAGST
jgi:hypothetical protein